MRLVERETHGEVIQVTTQGDAPTSLIWKGKRYGVVAVEASWCVDGRWWLDASRQGRHRRYYLVTVISPTRQQLCIEIYRFRAVWKLSRIAD